MASLTPNLVRPFAMVGIPVTIGAFKACDTGGLGHPRLLCAVSNPQMPAALFALSKIWGGTGPVNSQVAFLTCAREGWLAEFPQAADRAQHVFVPGTHLQLGAVAD